MCDGKNANYLNRTDVSDDTREGGCRRCDGQTTQVRLLQEWSRRLGVTVASGLLLVAGVKRKAWRHTGGQNSTSPRLRPPPPTIRAAARTRHRPPGPEPRRPTPITLDVRATAVEVSTARGAFGAAASHI